ncbi:hypothetical protein PMG11_06300 [Penicillium brasilianum]|uniref:Uncharacterized protein n=1 Tax=Penicillium brasilianum TaxID=104259 RepID=A0A0F7TRI6_PENBI|nr:hypothetical protein PMG11_06300 [Penicillium brasilianum]
MKIEVPYAQEGETSPTSPKSSSKATPEVNAMTTSKSSPDTSPSTSTSSSTIASSTPPRVPSHITVTMSIATPGQLTDPNLTMEHSTCSDPESDSESDPDSDSDSEGESMPFEVQFASLLNLGYPGEDYYSSRYSIRLPSGYWLPNEISLEHVVENIPIIGFVNEYNQPIPSLDGPDIHLTLASIDTITRIGEENDQTAMLDLGQVFYLHGTRKGQLNDAYAWIALRGNEEDKFAMSRRARNRLVPNWKSLIKNWEDFDECIIDTCHELRKMAIRGSSQAIHCAQVICAENGIDLVGVDIGDLVTGKVNDIHPAAKLLTALQRVLVTAYAFEDTIEKMQAIVDNMEV